MIQDAQSRQCKEILRKNNLNPIKRLGKGGFGVVYLVSMTDYNTYETELFSVKCTNKRNFVKKPVLRRYLKQQINLLQNIEHHNVVKLIRTFEENGWIFMVMQYCNLGNLGHLQIQKPAKVFTLPEATQILDSVIQGLEHMHHKNIIHRDIKPENILLNKSEKQEHTTVKICDLGFAREAEDNAETFCGTTYYMAPEIYAKKKYDNKVDVWAVGVLLFYMLFGANPFKSLNMLAEIENKCSKGFELQNAKTNKNTTLSSSQFETLRELFNKIFKIDPTERITLAEVRQHLSIASKKKMVVSPKTSSKETLDSEGNSEEQLPEFHIQEIDFIQQVKNEVCELKFLTGIEELALKYYLDKVCLSIFITQDNNSSSSKHLPPNLIKDLKNSQHVDSVYLASNLSKLNIKKFSQVFSSNSSTNFQNYKQAYRLVIGHAFYRAHKSIEDQKLKNQIKLKLFCCHVINRVFDKAHLKELFKSHFEWMQARKRGDTFSLPIFKQWIQAEQTHRLIETVQAINNKFYRKQK